MYFTFLTLNAIENSSIINICEHLKERNDQEKVSLIEEESKISEDFVWNDRGDGGYEDLGVVYSSANNLNDNYIPQCKIDIIEIKENSLELESNIIKLITNHIQEKRPFAIRGIIHSVGMN